jgi:hypothetical protein
MIDFLLSARRDAAAAKGFFQKVISELKQTGELGLRCRCRPVRYLNNIVEQDHRAIKRRVRASQGFRAYYSAWRTLQGIERVNMIRRDFRTNSFAATLSFSQLQHCLRKDPIFDLAMLLQGDLMLEYIQFSPLSWGDFISQLVLQNELLAFMVRLLLYDGRLQGAKDREHFSLLLLRDFKLVEYGNQVLYNRVESFTGNRPPSMRCHHIESFVLTRASSTLTEEV